MALFTSRCFLRDLVITEELVKLSRKFNDDMSPDEMNIRIQADRVVYVLNRCLAKISTVAHLPHILYNDAALIRKYLKPDELNFILEVLDEWGLHFTRNELYYESNLKKFLRLGTVNRVRRGKYTIAKPVLPEQFPNPAVSQMMDILFYNKRIQCIIRTSKNPKIDRHVMSLIKVMQELKETTKSLVHVTGDNQKELEKKLRSAYKANFSLDEVIAELNEQLQKHKEALGGRLDKRLQILEMYDEELQGVKNEFRAEIKKILDESEKIMMLRVLKKEGKTVNLAEEAKKLVKHYQEVLRSHLQLEEVSRAKHLKVETQLRSLISTFDRTIGGKQAELDKLQDEYNKKKAEIDKAQKCIDDQEAEYNKLMAEKAKEEEKILSQKTYEFVLNRSARKIQKYWRAYVEKKAARKRKGKKKK